MPRVANESPAVTQWSQETGDGGSSWDLCLGCYWDMVGRPIQETGLLTYRGGEPQGTIEGGADHPPYEDEDYDCDVCGRRLTWRDD